VDRAVYQRRARAANRLTAITARRSPNGAFKRQLRFARYRSHQAHRSAIRPRMPPLSNISRSTSPLPTGNRARTDLLAIYFALSWLHMLWESSSYFRSAAPAIAPSLSYTFHALAWLGYSALYAALALLPAFGAAQLRRRGDLLFRILAVAGTSIGLLVLRTDRSVFDLYNFHINGFVLNLVLTPGGLDSLGGGSDSYTSAALLAARIVALQSLALFAARVAAPRLHACKRHAVVGITALLLAGSGICYGIGDLRNDGAILDTADNYPLFMRVRFRGLAAQLGMQVSARARAEAVAKIDTARLQYPLQPMRYDGATRPLNIVWLVAESLRWDQLTADIMPNTWALAQRGQYFRHHYSSGNGTREGLFGVFYGLYGSYWDNFLYAGRGPLLIQRLQALDYRMELRTSARFTYPEFDRTLFVDVPRAQLHEEEFQGRAWERDRDNTSALIAFIRQNRRERSADAHARPFFSFMFFESTHARYTFPDTAIIRRPYLETVDYTAMSREKLAGYADQLRNRYSNAAHWVDAQIGRVIADLERQQLLDSTLIIVTGDHGEEFVEKGFWGHNSSFVEEQTRTPLVLWLPGMAPQRIERTTSHMDIAVTLLQLLGASNPVGDYALGRNLFDDSARAAIVVSDWHSIGINAADFKYRIPYASRGVENYRPTRGDDRPFANRDAERCAIAQHRQLVLDAARNITRFAR